MMRSNKPRRHRQRLPWFHVVLVHAQVLLLLLTPCTQAGDILHMAGAAGGGTGGTGTTTPNSAAPVDTAAATAQAQGHAQDMLARNTMALQAVTAMQEAAHAAAAGATNAGANPNFPGQTLPDVPNGLGTGGLDIAGTPTGANAPTQSMENARTIVNIQQTQQQALLYWNTFNVGSSTTVKFDQSAGGADAGTWIAFNKITDPSGNPTQILGSIEAQGQVYIINQNGIIFGAGSEVSTHALVASALPLNDNLVTRGLLNNPDSQFLFSALAQPAGTKGPTPAYTPPAPPAGKIGSVTVQTGAKITSPTSSANVGGLVALIGPNVTNNGRISTPDGQTVLAAGMQVGFTAHASGDASLRGLDVYVGDVGTEGTVTNNGIIDSARANVTMAGKNVNQTGVITSSTSVTLNGRIDIDASYNATPNTFYDSVNRPSDPQFLKRSTGAVVFGANSVTQILPEWSSTQTVVGTELALRSQMNVTGLTVYFGQDSVVYAPNAVVAVSAGVWEYTSSNAGSTNTLVHSSGQIYLDEGAEINVQGSTDVNVPVTQYIQQITLRQAELANFPVQKNSGLLNSTITVDLRRSGVRTDGSIWYGTPLADLSGYVGVIQRTVGELTTAGGSVTLNAGGSVVLQTGAQVDVSGGWVDYGGSTVQTTQLLLSNQTVDIANADPTIRYDGIYQPGSSTTDPRFGVTSSSGAIWTPGSYYQPGYLQGGSGGSLSISAAAMALDGVMTGLTVSGPYQREIPAAASSLDLKWQADVSGFPDFLFNSPTPPLIEFGTTGTQAPAGAFTVDSNGLPLALSADRTNHVMLSPTLLTSSGFGRLSVVNFDGQIIVPEGVTLQTQVLGAVTLVGANVSVLGSIVAPGGEITLKAYNISPAEMARLTRQPPAADPAPNSGRGVLTLGAASVLSTAGLLVNDVTAAGLAEARPIIIQGGSITAEAYSIVAQEGSVLDVSGGVYLRTNGTFQYGNAGTLSLLAGANPDYSYRVGSQDIHLDLKGVTGGTFELGSTMLGFSGAKGGTLNLQAQMIQVGGSTGNAQTLLLDAGLFSRGGFSTFDLTGFGTVGGADYLPAVSIAAGTQIMPQVMSYVATANSSVAGGISLTRWLAQEGVRNPATLNFHAPGLTDDFSTLLTVRGDFVMGANSSIVTDALGAIHINAQTASILGSLTAPGGEIEIITAGQFPTLTTLNNAQPTLYVSAQSTLSAAGKTLLLPDAYGRKVGTVLAGGTVYLQGNIVAAAGSVMNVSGTSNTLDVNLGSLGYAVGTAALTATGLPSVGLTTQRARVDTNAGKITLVGGEELFVDSTLQGYAGGSNAVGGTLAVSSGRFYASGVIADPRDITLWVQQSGTVLPSTFGGIGNPVRNADTSIVPGAGYFAVSSFSQGGFDSLTLGGNVGFVGAVDITAAGALSVGSKGIIQADSQVNLTASYVSLGRAFVNPQQPQEVLTPFTKISDTGALNFFYFSPTYGSGTVNVTAKLIDVGTLSLQGVGQLNLMADNGAIRGDGVLDVAGSIYMRAAQIYPPTAVSFNVFAYDYMSGGSSHAGSVTIVGSGQQPLPLSAGGTLGIYASEITQGGTLVAPFGTINLGWDGIGGWDGAQSGPVDLITNQTAPVTRQLTLLTGSVTSVSAVDPLTGQGLTIPYGINLNGTSWIDPRGIDITGGGGPEKAVHLSALNVSTQTGSVINLSGGGELYAYRWVTGNGGTNDVLASEGSFAVLPGYAADYAPFGAYNSTASGATLGTDKGYTNSTLHVGDKIYLGASPGMAAGVYTLLPARYALLPGAFLVTPGSGAPAGSQLLPSGAYTVSGYRFDGLNSNVVSEALMSSFEVAAGSVVRKSAQYDDYVASTFLKAQAAQLGVAVPQLPADAGHVVLQAVQSMLLQGTLIGQTGTGGNGALVDISSPVDIVISSPGAAPVSGKLQLDSASLSLIGAGSLLIGGVRTSGTDGTHVTVSTNNLTVDNAGSTLSGTEVLLVAKQVLEVKSGSQIVQGTAGTASSTEKLIFGSAGSTGSGDGALVRVGSSANATITRLGRSGSTLPTLIVGSGVLLQGNSLVLDTTYGTSLDAGAVLNSANIALNSGSLALQLDSTVAVPPTTGLVLSGTALQSLASAKTLSLLSYTTLDIYGAGQVGNSSLVNLEVHAGQIRGFNQGGGTAAFVAQNLLVDNSANAANGTAVAGNGTLSFSANVIRLGSGTLQANQFSAVQMQASSGVQLEGNGGFTTNAALTITTPVIAGLAGAVQSIRSDAALMIQAPVSSGTALATNGLGASLSLQGARVEVDTLVKLPSGSLKVLATNGDVVVNGTLDLSGVRRDFQDVSTFTSGGQVSLTSSTGNVSLGATAVVNVSANAGGGNAGSVSISAPTGMLTVAGGATMSGLAGTGGVNGSFTLDVSSLGGLLLGSIAGTASASFTESLSVRVRTGDVVINDTIKAHQFQLAADAGSITVGSTGKIDASGTTGGTIRLVARKDVVLQGDSVNNRGATLTVAAQKFDSAGKGGAVSLEAGAAALVSGTYGVGTGTVDIQSLSSINLSVAAQTAASAGLGQFSGVLHLRAPQISGGTDVSVNAIQGTITGASSVTVEGYFIQDLTSSGGTITSTVQSTVQSNGNTFLGAGYTAMYNRIVGTNPLNSGLGSVLVLQPGAEIVNRSGDLTLGTTSSTTTSDWNLSTFRFGTKAAPGVLTLRAAGNLVFYNALSDGFTPTLANSNASWLWLAPVTTQVSTLPVNTQSWSYHLTAGADLSGVDFHTVQPMSTLSGQSGLLNGATAGSVLVGKNGGLALPTTPGTNATTSSAISRLYQVIRTGTGDIDISAGGDVILLNQFATIYTAGVGVQSATSVFASNDFVVPVLSKAGTQPAQGPLGVIQQTYAASYTMAGGNVWVSAGNDITHKTQNTQGVLIDDSERQLPVNWLYRRGFVDPLTGLFGSAGVTGNPLTTLNDPTASTTWWVDFSNFFEGVGALGGGNVTLKAGRDVANVDAVSATNARMPGKDPSTGLNVKPDADKLLQLGGGNVVVEAGRNIDGGVYYVERGRGTLTAGNSITTNATRTLSLGILNGFNAPIIKDSSTWLPTTLFVGDATFDVSAKKDVLLGPVANPFLLPQGMSNRYWYKTYFSTYTANSGVNVSSLGGSVTFREAATPGNTTADPLLYQWLTNVLLFNTSATQNASYSQPWLRLAESSTNAFASVSSIMPPTLKATSFSGDVNLVGALTLFPSAVGTIDLLAAGSVNGLRPTGTSTQLVPGQTVVSWGASTINLSDANPLAIPSYYTPYAYATLAGKAGTANTSANGFLSFIENLFNETGSTSGVSSVLQNKQSLHAPGVLHANDRTPVHIYASTGDITGITFYSAKQAQIIAGNDVSDISFYIQNTRADSTSIVASGRDIIAYNENTLSRIQSRLAGNSLIIGQSALAGDIQISGPGSLEVLAGRNLDLGTGANKTDGTGVGITSIGNGRNPYLPFGGADITVAAGMGGAALGLGGSGMDFTTFMTQFVNSAAGTRYLGELAEMLGVTTVNLNDPALTPEQQKQLALAVYYLVLRDAGRDHNNPESPNAGTYTDGFAAISALFPTTTTGTIHTQARDIRTKSGGDINILTPGGGLEMASTTIGSTLAPPGIITESGGNINIFADKDVTIGIARIFTLRGGDIMIWSSQGDIAAGSSSKTVQSAPPTRVLIDPQSANVATDLAGLATGGGIGVLASVAGVKPGNVDLIAPVGAVDAGDAGIRATGNLNIAATIVLNAANISVGGTSAGTPAAPAVAAPSLGGLAAASSSAAAATSATNSQAPSQNKEEQALSQEQPSVITVQVIGYGGGDGTDERKRRNDQPGE
ncbi:filamentous haemagglutinin family protein [Prosthecobacter fluviatilis]|uniref:Filamentous hemagglutinin family protein n=1 Tax=Prosthecobacter fluviatilis TaxID=445931 RepID=A0ABW0KUP7_9BACT